MRRHILLLLLAVPALAGPPSVCWPVEIGPAKSLPWGDNAFQGADAYDTSRVVEDTLRLLTPETPVLVRMETLRRAVLYIDRQRAARDALLKALTSRVLDAEAADQPAARAWFDAGYAHCCFQQNGGMSDRDGYLWVKKALRLSEGDPQIEYACALMTLMGSSTGHENFFRHLERAGAGEKADPLLHENLVSLRKLYPPVLRYFEEREREREKAGAEKE